MNKQLNYWFLAARPKTLPAAAVPVFIGGGLAEANASFRLLPWLICLLFALLIQIGTNFANDYYDFRKGADGKERIGPKRAVASGWIAPETMFRGMVIVFAVAFLMGCLLIQWGGLWLLVIGVLSIICGVAYTGGPYPLGYNGWGDVFVFIFFGWIATAFTYYVQAGSFATPAFGGDTHWVWLAGMVPGALATNLLAVNNVRDEPQDRITGKRTLVVRFGHAFGLLEYGLMSLIAVVVPLWFAMAAGCPGCYLIILALPLAIGCNRKLMTAQGRDAYEKVLVLTALMLLVAGGLFAVGLVVPF
jgi:1,4-dihydroxy-2-naphthoate octaprenyltransferase